MYRGTTPVVSFLIKSEFDFDIIEEVWVTLSSWDVKQTFKLSENDVTIDAESRTISVFLSQEHTLAFEDGEVEIQLRMLDKRGLAYANEKVSIEIGAILEDGIIAPTKPEPDEPWDEGLGDDEEENEELNGGG